MSIPPSLLPRTCALLLIVIVLTPWTPTRAEPVEVAIDGFVANLEIAQGPLSSVVGTLLPVGSPITVRYTFETNSVPQVIANQALYIGALLDQTVEFPTLGLSFTSNGGATSTILLTNDLVLFRDSPILPSGNLLRDQITMGAQNAVLGGTLAGMNLQQLNVQFATEAPIDGPPPALVDATFAVPVTAFRPTLMQIGLFFESIGVAIVATPDLRVPDADGDRVVDALDNCPLTANPDQADRGGLGDDTPDGVGDACQNGDFDGDGSTNLVDVVLLRRGLVGIEPTVDPALPPTGPAEP